MTLNDCHHERYSLSGVRNFSYALMIQTYTTNSTRSRLQMKTTPRVILQSGDDIDASIHERKETILLLCPAIININ